MKGSNLPITEAFLYAATVTGVGEEGGETMDPLLTAGLKVASSKEGEGGNKKKKKIGGREERGRPGGIFFLALLRVEGSQEEVP